MRAISFLAATVLAAAIATPASAGVITTTVNFSLGGIIDVEDSPPLVPPVATVSGSFTLTFDPTLGYTDDTTDITVNNFSGPVVSSVLGFTYDPTNKFLWFGGLQNGASLVVAGTNDFVLTLDATDINDPVLVPCNASGILCGAVTGSAAYEASGYTVSADGAIFLVATRQSNVAAPEPVSISLLGIGLLGTGLASRRRKRA